MLVYEKQSVPEPNHPSVMEASTSSCKRKSSEPITGIPNKMAPVQEPEEEDSYPDLPSPGYVLLRRAANHPSVMEASTSSCKKKSS